MPLHNYEGDMNGMKRVSDKKALQGAKLPKESSREKAQKTPYDASHGMYLKKGGAAKKMKKGGYALGGAAKVRKGMMSEKGMPKA
jgi:hypothetical protein